MSSLLKSLLAAEVISPLDYHLATSLTRLGEASHEVALGAALASRAVQGGHICADLRTLRELVAPKPPVAGEPPGEVRFALPELNTWLKALRESSLVSPKVDAASPTPLILDDKGRLYLYRYAQYQERLAESLRARLGPVLNVDWELAEAGLKNFFGAGPGNSTASTGANEPGATAPLNLQRLAAIAALGGHLTVVSGGPGTGKTYAVTQVLALVVEQALARGEQAPRILLVAPTGKAAQRLGESIQQSLGQNTSAETKSPTPFSEEVLAAIPRSASTIHRVLGFQPRSPTRFRHSKSNPIAADVVLVDEASMVDLALMTKLVDSVPQSARLILLGDQDQLASVEAGAILGDICNAERAPGYSAAFARRVATLTGEQVPIDNDTKEGGLADCMVHLRRSRRYDGKSGIGLLARAISSGQPEALNTALHASEDAQLIVPSDDSRTFPAQLANTLVLRLHQLSSGGPGDKLRLLSSFRILCAHRRGAFGVEDANLAAEAVLNERGAIQATGELYVGRPLLITANDYSLDLYNGDIGVIDKNPSSGALEAYFTDAAGQLRAISPARLPPHRTVFAMTVHKSQGSEFDEVALMLPPEVSPVVTRELVYTGITRAKKRVAIYAKPAILEEAITRRVERASGLRDALWRQ